MTNDYGVEIQCEPQLCTIPLEEYESLNKRIAELEAYEARIKELESQLENVQNTMATENVDLGMENHKLKERIKELEAENARLKA